MSTNSPNVPQQKSSQGIPGWVAGLIVAVVLAIGFGYLAMQFLKEDPKKPSMRSTTKPGPGAPGSGPTPPPGGPSMAPGAGRPKGTDSGTESPEAKSTPEKEPAPEKESK